MTLRVNKKLGQKVAILLQTAAKVRQQIWVFKISISPINSRKLRFLAPNFVFLKKNCQKFFGKKTTLKQPKIRE